MILALDTSAEFASIALGEILSDGTLAVREEEFLQKRRSAEGLLELIDTFESRYSDRPVELIAASIGPGSYTGIRAGFALAQGLSFARDLPLLAVSSFVAKLLSGDPAEGVHEVTLISRPGEELFSTLRVERDPRLKIEVVGEIQARTCSGESLTTQDPSSSAEELRRSAFGVLRAAYLLDHRSTSPHLRFLNPGDPCQLLYGKPVQAQTLVERGIEPPIRG